MQAAKMQVLHFQDVETVIMHEGSGVKGVKHKA